MQVYDASETLLSRLSDEAKKLAEWAALGWAEAAAGGSEALEALVEAQCSEVEEFEANLRGLKVSVVGAGRAGMQKVRTCCPTWVLRCPKWVSCWPGMVLCCAKCRLQTRAQALA
jgi:hypothetical protein